MPESEQLFVRNTFKAKQLYQYAVWGSKLRASKALKKLYNRKNRRYGHQQHLHWLQGME